MEFLKIAGVLVSVSFHRRHGIHVKFHADNVPFAKAILIFNRVKEQYDY